MTIFHDTIHAYAAAITALNPDAFAACFAENCELHDPVGAPPALGHAGARAFFGAFQPLLKSIHLRAGHVYLNGHEAAFTWTLEATGVNGKTATADGIDTFHFDAHGKILRSNGYWDPAPFVAALMS